MERWKNTETESPDFNVDVLIFCKKWNVSNNWDVNGFITIGYLYCIKKSGNVYRDKYSDEIYQNDDSKRAFYWMSLPDFPEKIKEEEIK